MRCRRACRKTRPSGGQRRKERAPPALLMTRRRRPTGKTTHPNGTRGPSRRQVSPLCGCVLWLVIATHSCNQVLVCTDSQRTPPTSRPAARHPTWAAAARRAPSMGPLTQTYRCRPVSRAVQQTCVLEMYGNVMQMLQDLTAGLTQLDAPHSAQPTKPPSAPQNPTAPGDKVARLCCMLLYEVLANTGQLPQPAAAYSVLGKAKKAEFPSGVSLTKAPAVAGYKLIIPL